MVNIEELKFDLVSRLESVERGDHVFMMVDSIGNLASKKEYENAMAENSSKDMTRAQEIKSLFRITTPHITMKNLPCLVIAHTYKEMGLFPKDVISGGCVVPKTLVATDQETHSAKWTTLIALYYTFGALLIACVAYHIGLLIW